MDFASLVKLPHEDHMENVADDFLRISGKDISIKAATSHIVECFLVAYEKGLLSEYKKKQKTYYVFDLSTPFKSA